MAHLPDRAQIIIIGGGVIGLSCAYHLAKLGARDVILLERHQLTSGTSWHAAGIIGPLRASMNLTKLAAYATELLPAIEAETGQATGYKQTGGFWLAQTEERMYELRRIADIGQTAGLTPEILSPEEIGARLNLLNTADIAGGMWVAEDGQANPVDVCMAYAKGARDNGARLYEGVNVATVHAREGAVRLHDSAVLGLGRAGRLDVQRDAAEGGGCDRDPDGPLVRGGGTEDRQDRESGLVEAHPLIAAARPDDAGLRVDVDERSGQELAYGPHGARGRVDRRACAG